MSKNLERIKAIAMRPLGDLPVIGWVGVGFGAVAMAAIYLLALPSPEAPAPQPESVAVEKTPEEIREEKFKRAFSAWDGSHRELTQVIKGAMNDPKTYEHVKTVYFDKGDFFIVTTEFRGANKFGGVVLDSVSAKVDLEGNLLELLPETP